MAPQKNRKVGEEQEGAAEPQSSGNVSSSWDRAWVAREERMRLVLDSVRDGLVTVDQDGTIESVNKAAGEIFGLPEATIIGMKIDMFLSPPGAEPLPDIIETMLAAMESGQIGKDSALELQRVDGTVFLAELVIKRLHHQGRRLYTVVVRDVTERQRFQRELEKLALSDTLTGLPNRAFVLRHLPARVAALDGTARSIVMAQLNIDRFKDVNMMFGLAFGDRVLGRFATTVGKVLAEHEMLARITGDGFVVIAETDDPHAAIADLRKRVTGALRRPFVIEDVELPVTSTCGISVFPEHAETAHDLINSVETALFYAKENGRGAWQVFDDTTSRRRSRHLNIEKELRRAIDREEIHVHFQPKLSTVSCRVTGSEALVRWTHPTLGVISPAVFVPIAEETGMIHALGQLVLETACRMNASLIDKGLDGLSVAVNLSTRQFRDSHLASLIAGALSRTGLPPSCLQVELTEGDLIFDVQKTVKILNDLKDLGVTVAIDDFGTGYSSLSYLTKLPLDVLKIDRAFVQGVPDLTGDVAIVTAIVSMAKALKLDIVAEGVETQTQLGFMSRLGCDEIQGHIHSGAISAVDFEAFVRASAGLTGYQA